MRGAPAGQHGGDHIEHDRQAGAFPVSDRQRPAGGFDRGWIARQLPGAVEPAWHRQRLAAAPVRGERAVGKLRHRHVEHDVTAGARDRDDQRIVADARRVGAPRRKVGKRVGPADGDRAGVSRLPAVRAATQPMPCSRDRAIAASIASCAFRAPTPPPPSHRSTAPDTETRAARARTSTTPLRIIVMRRGNRFRPCEGTPSRVESAIRRAQSAARSGSRPVVRSARRSVSDSS